MKDTHIIKHTYVYNKTFTSPSITKLKFLKIKSELHTNTTEMVSAFLQACGALNIVFALLYIIGGN